MTQLGAGLAAKRLEILKEVVPNLSRVAFLWNPANPDQKSHFNEAQAGARSLGVTLQSVEARSADELERDELVYRDGDLFHIVCRPE